MNKFFYFQNLKNVKYVQVSNNCDYYEDKAVYSCLALNQFIHDELRASDMNSRQSHFHGKDHMISVNDLWKTWRQSEGTIY